ncbi:MAG: DUF1616 domain-containing protein [Candidatus Bathyarchaeia archaeon]
MRSESSRSAALALALAAAFVLSSNIVYWLLPDYDSREHFNELWLLSTDHKVEGLPSRVVVDEPFEVLVGVRNRVGRPAGYSLLVKLRNETDPLPDSDGARPSPLPTLCRFDLFLDENEGWEALVKVKVVEADVSNGQCLIRKIEVNGTKVIVNSPSVRSRETTGFSHELFFELWRQDLTNGTIVYDNRFVGFWLDVKGCGEESSRIEHAASDLADAGGKPQG